LQNLISREVINNVTYTKYSDGTMEIRGIKFFDKPSGDIDRFDDWLYFDIPFINTNYTPILSGHGAQSGTSNCVVNFDNPSGFQKGGFKVSIIQALSRLPLNHGAFVSFNILGRWK
ncbi:hypothetical protein HS141_16670, partial [Cetobacterium somerae]|uniref:hypothetical protein n=1 Tax=Cetobacterium somerae TaxID=188913 RepID=UPI00211EAF03